MLNADELITTLGDQVISVDHVDCVIMITYRGLAGIVATNLHLDIDLTTDRDAIRAGLIGRLPDGYVVRTEATPG